MRDMWNNIAAACFLIALGTGSTIQYLGFHDTTHHSAPLSQLIATTARDVTVFDAPELVTAVDGDDAWTSSVRRGDKLLQGMHMSNKGAAELYGMGESVESPYDGDLHGALESWGYNDNSEALKKVADKECNMDSASGHMLKKTFGDLGMTTKPKSQGGSNECFLIQHYNSPAVILDEKDKTQPEKAKQFYKAPCGTEFRITGAEHTVGVNAEGAAIFAMDIKSPAKAARSLWRRAAKIEELPHIRSFSDISWACWNRAAAGNIQNIKYLFVTMIINTETNRHIKQALKTLKSPKEEAEGWPGSEFEMATDAGKALLGSPVGRWAGYFLMQHKRQLGGSKYISKVRVFKSEKPGSLPYFLFYVEGPDAEIKLVTGAETSQLTENTRNSSVESRLVKMSTDSKSVVKQHFFHAKF
ncbi:hypothetical protein BDU57DRAFT_518268 [Ampelomyces quisqualis]|uniref:Uncharacterized protein n=1 Tax=Ampelomyces quisqualis TaxID=50730 RepID=A0A6A5QLJ5_AMPQU|nr:hypothetical protein BDU57DRAFT_518268 [Ampelomyces quisqualis]